MTIKVFRRQTAAILSLTTSETYKRFSDRIEGVQHFAISVLFIRFDLNNKSCFSLLMTVT